MQQTNPQSDLFLSLSSSSIARKTARRLLYFLLIAVVLLSSFAHPSAAQGWQLFLGNFTNNWSVPADVLRYDGTTGKFINHFMSTRPTSSQRVQFGADGTLYIGVGNGTDVIIKRYDGFSGAFLGDLVTVTGPKSVEDMTFGPDGNLYLTDFQTHAVYRINGTTGAYMPSPGQSGAIFVPPGRGGMNNPRGIVFAPDGSLLVSSENSGQVLRFDGMTGFFMGAFVSYITHPMGLTFGPDGNLYVASSTGNFVNRYNGFTGDFLDTFVLPNAGGLVYPHGIAFGPDGNLYVRHYDSNRTWVKRYHGTTGAFIDDFIPPGTGGLVGFAYLTFRPPTTFFTYSAANDFDKTNNPSQINTFDSLPLWSYGGKARADLTSGPFVLYNATMTNNFGLVMDTWYETQTGNSSSVCHNSLGDQTISGVLFPYNSITAHPSSNGQYAVVRWTAPTSGRIHVSGFFEAFNPFSGTADVRVVYNSTEMYYRETNGPAPPFDFTSALSGIINVNACDTFDFAVGYGANNNYSSDHTRVSVAVDFEPTEPAVPCPPTHLTAEPVADTDDQIRLTWTDASQNETEFRLYRKREGEPNFTQIATIAAVNGSGASVQFLDTGLMADTTYTYYVTAANAAGESTPSNEASARTRTSSRRPDLQASGLMVSPETLHVGQSALLSLTITNQGDGATAADQSSWQEGIYLSSSAVFNPATARRLTQIPHTGRLGAGESYTLQNQSVLIPADIGQEGDYYLFVKTDDLDQVSEPSHEDNNISAGKRVHLLNAPPDTFITAGPAPNTTVCGPDVNFTVSGSDDGTPTNQLQYQWRVDTGEWSAWTTDPHILVQNLSDGSHTFAVRARDSSGNSDPTPAQLAFRVDNSPPVISNIRITVFPLEAYVEWDTNENAMATVEFGSTTQYGSQVEDPRLRVHHRLRIDNYPTPLHLRVRSTDACGHQAVSEDQFITLTLSNVHADVPAIPIGFTRANVLYNTSLLVESHVEYGRSVFYNKAVDSAAQVTQHNLELTPLSPSTTYHYRVWASRGNVTVYSADQAFRTRQGSQQIMNLSGTISLEECVNREQLIRFEFRPLDNSEVLVLGARLSANGSYTLIDVPRKNYTLAIKGAKWLQKTQSITAPALGDLNGINASLLAGDANNDNLVDVLDLARLIENFDSTSSDPFWDESADFNCDGSIDVLDLHLLIRNFDKTGDT